MGKFQRLDFPCPAPHLWLRELNTERIEMPQALHIACPGCHAVNRVPADRLDQQPKCGKCRQPMFSGQPLSLDERGFQHFLQRNDLPLLVDFWAPWCGPCRMMAPAFEQAAAQLEPQVRLVKVNTEAHQQLAMRYAIRSIPTLVLFRGGKEIARAAGAMDTAGLVGWTRQNL